MKSLCLLQGMNKVFILQEFSVEAVHREMKKRGFTFYLELLMPACEGDWILLEMGKQAQLGS